MSRDAMVQHARRIFSADARRARFNTLAVSSLRARCAEVQQGVWGGGSAGEGGERSGLSLELLNVAVFVSCLIVVLYGDPVNCRVFIFEICVFGVSMTFRIPRHRHAL